MTLVKNPKKTPVPQSKEKKTAKPIRATGAMKMIDGVAVMMPPEEKEESSNETNTNTVIGAREGVITVQAEDTSDEDSQHVHDSDSEDQSRRLAERIKKENDARADAAAMETTPRKVGDTIVAYSDSYDDIDLALLDGKGIDTES